MWKDLNMKLRQDNNETGKAAGRIGAERWLVIPCEVLTRRTQRGIQLTELAIALPIMMALIAAIAEFGNYFYTYTTLAKATRASSRYISSKVFTEVEKNKAKNLCVCGNENSCGSTPPIMSGLSSGNVQITSQGSPLLPQTVTVRIVGYKYNPIFDLSKWTGGQPWANVDVSPSTTMRYMLEN